MANPIPLKLVKTIIIADATDWPGGGSHGWGDDDYQIDLTSVAAAAAREGAKVDLAYSGILLPEFYVVRLALEYAVAPGDGKLAYVHFGRSNSATAGTDNEGGTSGTDGVYTGTAGSTLAESIGQLLLGGLMPLTNDATTVVQIGNVGLFVPTTRYVNPVVENAADQALHSDVVEMGIRLDGYLHEAQ